MLSAILLAAGSSRRMGLPNKLLLPWQGKPFVAATAENILAAGITELILVTGHDAPAITTAVSHLPVHVIHNPDHEKGMTGSIQTGVRHATGDGYMICLADMVLITPGEYILLIKAFEQQYSRDIHCIILPQYRQQKGNPVIFSSTYREAILRHKEEEGCKTLVRSHAAHHHRIVMPADHILRDIDTPEDYERLPRS